VLPAEVFSKCFQEKDRLGEKRRRKDVRTCFEIMYYESPRPVHVVNKACEFHKTAKLLDRWETVKF
jgi:hypothetical protein